MKTDFVLGIVSIFFITFTTYSFFANKKAQKDYEIAYNYMIEEVAYSKMFIKTQECYKEK